jgi:2-octaprenyl-6-methoxyphenol hydroxylase
MATTTTQAAVIGAGPAGLVAALALEAAGIEVAIVAPPYETKDFRADRRTTALVGPSIQLLKNIGVWRICEGDAAPIFAVRIGDDRGSVVRAPELSFAASELGLESFGANIANPALLAALDAAASRAAGVVRIATSAVTRIEPDTDGVWLRLAEGGSMRAALAVGADGRNSIARAAAGIVARTWTYPQAAIVTTFRHTRPHNGTVNELHRRSGPLTTVPLPGSASALVWVEEPQEARRLAGLDDGAFAAILEERLQGVLGRLDEVGPRALYPLSGLRAERLGAGRIALVGEAAHVVPPIGAQGLNLGLRDAAALAECVAEAREQGSDIGGPQMLAAYERARSSDVLARSVAIDLLNRSLLTDLLPLDMARGLAVHVLARLGPLRRLLMQGGMAGGGPLPRLMRPNALGRSP